MDGCRIKSPTQFGTESASPRGVRRVVHLGLGSNLGNRAGYLAAACHCLGSLGKVVATSPIYETVPVSPIPQPLYYNQAVALCTDLPTRELLVACKRIERELGRTPGPQWGPRVIDLDILLDAANVIADPDLVVPHPHLVARAFALIPLADIAPTAIHPTTGLAVADLAAEVPGRDTIRRVSSADPLEG